MTAQQITVEVTSVFKRNYEALVKRPERYICNEGGSRSSKSYSVMQLLIAYCHQVNGLRVTVCSHSLPHLKRGSMRDFMVIMQEWNLYSENSHNKTEQLYQFPNGSYIEFFGLEEGDRARGAGRDILFVNEANLVKKSVFDQLNMRTTKKVIIDLNPSDFDCWCYALADGPNAIKLVSTYKDNLKNLTPEQISVIEGYKDADPLMWQVFGLGQRGTSAEQIYTHWRICDALPGKGEVFYGLDFGYNVPSAFVKCEYFEGAIYAEEMLYQPKLTTNDLAEVLKPMDLGYNEIFCDAAEPKTIEELFRMGLNVKPADKDVTEGIRKVKSMPLYVSKNSKNLISELGSYKWKLDKEENVLDEPIKMNDHACDALRYAVFTKLITPTLYWAS